MQDEYELKRFYKIFNKLWYSGYHNQRALAIYTLKLYERDYDKETWKFLIPKLKEVNDFDEAEMIGRIIGIISIKNPALKNEVIKLIKRKHVYYRRMALSVCFPLIEKKDWNFIFKLIISRLYDKEENIQELNGQILKEISEKNMTIVKKFILKNMNMPQITFDIVSNNFKDLKKMRKIKKIDDKKFIGFGWLRLVR